MTTLNLSALRQNIAENAKLLGNLGIAKGGAHDWQCLLYVSLFLEIKMRCALSLIVRRRACMQTDATWDDVSRAVLFAGRR